MRHRCGSRLALLVAWALAAGLVFFSQEARGGQVHPDLEPELSALPPGGTIPVIVEMSKQANPAVAAATVPRRQRVARRRAVRDALEMLANQDQTGVRALLAREQGLGSARRVIPFWVINGLSVHATEPVIRRLAARSDVKEVRLDRSIRGPRPLQPAAGPAPTTSTTSEWNIDQIRAPEVWALDPNYSGVGTVVGSFDTGVDVTHPDLASRYRGNHGISWFDPYGQHATPFDANGHGTHTTGTAVGGDASGANIGVAPGAKWIAAKGFNDFGFGSVSAFHQIFQWFLAPGGDPANAPDVVNASWAFEETGCITEFRADILALRAAGIFPSFAAGNDGPDDGSVRSPGAEPESFTVGATDLFDDVAFFSARGPSPCGGIVKPDVSAPGDFIVSAYPGNDYLIASGTSMATPHITGAVAVLRSINPALTVDELAAALTLGAVDLGDTGPDNSFGAGRLDLFQSAQIVLGGVGRPFVTITATDSIATEAPLTTAMFTVIRTGSTDEELTVHFTVSGTGTPGSDYVALPASVTIPAGSASETMVVTLVDDTLPESEETVVVTLTVDPGYIVGVPGNATATIVSDEVPPDLVVSALSVPGTVGNLSAFTVADTTANQGGIGASASTTRFYLSADGTIDAGDNVLGSRSIPAFGAGGTNSGSITVAVPPGTAAGTYYFIARADADGAVAESQEGNNTRTVVIQVRGEIVVTPSAIDLATPPAAFSIAGNGFVNLGFGLPVVNFVRNGVVLAQARATGMTATTLTVPFPTSATASAPNLPGLSAGAVDVQAFLQTGSASYSLLGNGPLTVTDSTPMPGVNSITPSSIDLATPPATFSIAGNGFVNLGFGLPVVNFSRNGTVLAQARATGMTATTLTVPFPTGATAIAPNLPGLSAGAVIVQVYRQTGSATYSLIGSTSLTATDTRPAPGVSSITPNAIDLIDPPATFSIAGNGFVNLGFGLPVVNFSRNGTVVAQARATAMTATTVTVPFPTSATAIAPNLPGLSAGAVVVQVYQQTAASSYSLLGSTSLTVADTRPPAGVTGITPSTVSLAAPPPSFTITGGRFENLGFGLPVVNFSRNGIVLAQARGTAKTATTLTVPYPTSATAIAPNLPGLSPGAVTVQVWLQTGASTYSLLGSTSLTVQ